MWAVPNDFYSLEKKENILQYNYNKFSEQYENSKAGLRQNFIVQTVPENTKETRVRLEVKGVEISQVSATELQFQTKESSFNYNDLVVWDKNNTPLYAYFEAKEDNTFDIVVNTSNAVFPITVDPIITSGNPSNANTQIEANQVDALFGSSVSSAGDVNGDGYSDVIVGAPNYDNGQSNEGVVFIFHGSATGISTTPTTILEINQANARFGFSVASAGDVNGDGFSDVVVGADYYVNGQSNEGGVFIFHGSVSGVSTTASTVLESNITDAQWGVSVSCAGDVNGDGYSDIIVGAPNYDNGEDNEGAFHVFHGSVSGLSTTPSTSVESNQNFAEMGLSVSSAGDVNGDGYSDIIVGAPNYNNGQFFEGVAFVYLGSVAGIYLASSVILEANQVGAVFGRSVACAGDVNGDGYSDIIVGAYNYDNGQTNEGAAFVFHGSASGINTMATITLESNQNDASFGFSVSCAGDVNGDGYSDIIVGSDNYDNGQTNEGATFVFHGSVSGINSSIISTLESNFASANMGRSVACAGDVNGDGFSDIITGAYHYTNGESNEGAAFIFHGSAFSVNNLENTALESNQVSANLGWSVSGGGDINGDGFSDIVVGVPNYDNGQSDEGAAFIYYGSLTGLSTTPDEILESNQANANFGYSVANAGDINGDGYSDVIVGSPKFQNGEFDEGAVLVYHGSSSSLVLFDTLESNLTNTFLGWSVSTAGDVNADGYSDIIVGAYGYTNGESNEGAAYIYHGSISGVDSLPNKIIESNQAGAYAGWSVSTAGNINGDQYSDILIGARLYDNGESNEGAVFVHLGNYTGVRSAIHATLESNQIDANMGASVACAGDVNGDGYSDIIVGSTGYTNDQSFEGAMFLYLGSNIGLNATEDIILESNQNNSLMGWAVASAGDINGDGYSDILSGAYDFQNSQASEGKVFVYHGNKQGGIKRALRVYNPSSTTPIQQTNKEIDNFGIGLFAKSYLGRAKGKLVWEVTTDGGTFTGSPITNSVNETGIDASFTNLGILGTQLTNDITKEGFENKIRARVKYDLVTAITGQVYGPWIYRTINTKTILGEDNPLPIELLSFEVTIEKTNVIINWKTVSEINNDYFSIERSTNGLTWELIKKVKGAGNASQLLEYKTTDEKPHMGISYYRIKQTDFDGKFSYSPIRAIHINVPEKNQINIYPNPSFGKITIDNLNIESSEISLYNSEGLPINISQFLIEKSSNGVSIDLTELKKGLYFIRIGGLTQKIYKL